VAGFRAKEGEAIAKLFEAHATLSGNGWTGIIAAIGTSRFVPVAARPRALRIRETRRQFAP
jgi:hypothetical protein